MGRRGTDSTGVVPAPADTGGRAWDAVRRALGRTFARAAVRQVTTDRLLPAVSVRHSPATDLPALAPGRGEEYWRAESAVRAGAIPQALAGAGEREWRPDAVLGAMDGAISAPACRVLPTLGAGTTDVRAEPLAPPVESVRLPDAFVVLPSSPVRVQRQGFPAVPATRRVPDFRPAAPRTLPLRLPRPAAPPVRWGGDAVLGRMPLTRRGWEVPPGVPPGDAFPAERGRLAETAGLEPEAVTLLGVFPAVPIMAVRRLVVDEGRLRLWLKPEALRGPRPPRLITLIVGRRVSDGKMLQAAL